MDTKVQQLYYGIYGKDGLDGEPWKYNGTILNLRDFQENNPDQAFWLDGEIIRHRYDGRGVDVVSCILFLCIVLEYIYNAYYYKINLFLIWLYAYTVLSYL